MHQKITHEILLQSFYDELSPEDNLHLELSLMNDPKLQLEYDQFSKTILSLDELTLQPSKKSISNILKYSKDELIAAH